MGSKLSPKLVEVGTVFGRLTATSDFILKKRPDGRNRCYQQFICECGNVAWLIPYSVKNGNTSSCGCIHSETISKRMTTHGLSKTSSYRVALNKARRSQKRAAKYTDNVETITASILAEILAEYNNTCWICDDKLDVVQWDHVHPLSKGGAHVRTNLRPSCKACNSRKGSLHPFTEELKTKIANKVRELRASQAYLPDTDGLEVH